MNSNLNKAKRVKNDEFYTQLSDIENELKHYKNHFKDKIVYLNCDNPQHSKFWTYFETNFKQFQLKRLVATYYSQTEVVYKSQLSQLGIFKTKLNQNGDFRSQECIQIMKQSDIVITNPPFSLFREYVCQLMEYDIKFLIIGNVNAITYKNFFPLIMGDKIRLGYTYLKSFIQPENDKIKKVAGLTRWFTNLEIDKKNKKLILSKKYYGNERDYPKYDNYDAIEVSRVKNIPCDYYGVMGVPITFIDKHNPKQFEIIDIDMNVNKTFGRDRSRFILNDKTLYARIIIKRKQKQINKIKEK